MKIQFYMRKLLAIGRLGRLIIRAQAKYRNTKPPEIFTKPNLGVGCVIKAGEASILGTEYVVGWFVNDPLFRQTSRDNFEVCVKYEYGVWPKKVYGEGI